MAKYKPILTVFALMISWNSFGGLLGVGPEFTVAEAFTVTPIVNAGIAYIWNDTEYSGPGADTSSAIFDGIAFNWDGWAALGGFACRADWVRPLGRGYALKVVGRYDIRWTRTFDTDSSAQEFSDRLQQLTLRSDVTGPMGLTPLDRMLRWRLIAGYRYFFEDSLFENNDIVLLGAGIEYDITDMLPMGTSLGVKCDVMFGEGISGYTIGMSWSF